MRPPVECQLEPPRAGGDVPALGRAGAIVEIGPYDLPPPEGGYEDFVLDDWDPAPAPAEAAALVPAPVPATESVPMRARTARWFLFPEALVVAGFVLIGLFFAGVTYWSRTARLAGAAPAAASRIEAAPDPAGLSPPAPRAAPSVVDVAALDPEPPPEPGLVPSAIEQLLPVPSDAPAGPPSAAAPSPGTSPDLAGR